MNSNDRADLIKRINTLEGLTDKERSALLGLLRKNKTYGLIWEDKPEDVEERLRDELPVLTEVPERAIISEDKDAPNHILIEGDNLEALATLAYTHEGKIDVIYIDPPYNTGKKNEFKYNDSWVDKDDLFKHTKWCSYINRRLKIAKKLLSQSGVIFLSIDDHEYSQLKSICDSIFFENNFICNFIWYTDGHTDNQDIFTNVHEYILCYSFNKNHIKPNNIVDPNIDESSKIQRDFAENSIIKNGAKNPPTRIKLPVGFPCEVESLNLSPSENLTEFLSDVKNNLYISREITKRYNMKYPVRFSNLIVSNYSLQEECEVFSGWMNPEKLKEFIKNDCNPIFESKTQTTLRFYLSKNGVIYYRREGRSSHYVQTVLENMGTTEQNKYMLERMGVSFDYPKPLKLIQYLLSLFSKKNSVCLDFFAGSGTTLHATMQLNAEDGGHRQCILVTNNENNICEEVTYVRNKRVINGYKTPKGTNVPGLTKNNLRYYRTGFVSRNRSMQNMRKLVNLATDMLCIKEDLYTEQNTFGGQKTYKGIFRYFDDGKKQMLVIYREEAIDELVDIIYDMDVPQPIKVYVFSPSEDPWEGSFDDVSDKVELCALPQAIYNTYRRILPKKKDTVVMPEEDALAPPEEDKDLFDGMLNFTDEEEA